MPKHFTIQARMPWGATWYVGTSDGFTDNPKEATQFVAGRDDTKATYWRALANVLADGAIVEVVN